MNLLALTGTSFVIALSGALMPGPLLAVTIEHSLKRGFRAGPLIILGHAILEFSLILVVVAGLGTFLKNPVVFTALSFVGAGLLLWMGQEMVRKAGRINLDDAGRQAKTKSSDHGLVIQGIIISLSNPYWSLWWVTLGLTYLAFAFPYGVVGVLLFFLGHIAADALWYGLVAYSVSKGKRFFSPPVYRVTVVVCGLFLIGFGMWLAVKQVIARSAVYDAAIFEIATSRMR